MPEPVLELIRIFKSYPGVQALRDVNLPSRPRGRWADCENGAGKKHLDENPGWRHGTKLRRHQASRRAKGQSHGLGAIRCGIAFVHQELNLFDNLDVAANVFFGREKLSFGLFHLIDTAAMVSRTNPCLRGWAADFDPDTPVAALRLPSANWSRSQRRSPWVPKS